MATFQSLGKIGPWSATADTLGYEVFDDRNTLTIGDRDYGPAWENQPSVRKVVGFAARNLASVPLHVFERRSDDDRVRVTEGPLADLLRRPSRAPAMTPYRFWESLLIDGLIHDKFCAKIIQHDDGYELVRIPATRVRFLNNGFGQIEKVKIFGSNGKFGLYDPAEYLIDVGYSENGVNGTSPLRTLKDLLAEQTEAVAYRRSIWKNGARIPGVLEREKPWSSDIARDRFARTWKSFTGGGGQSGGTPVLEDGMKYKDVNAFRPRDTNDLEGRRLSDIEVCSAYYIAPELVGAREGTFSNIKAFKQMLYGPALGPYIVAWEQMVNTALVPLIEPDSKIYVEANIEAKMRGSFEEQADVMSTAVGGPWMSRAEGRARLNLPFKEGTDDLIVPLNVLVGGQASPQDGKAFDDVLLKFAQRQRQAVTSQKSAGVHDFWDRGRWDRELIDDLMGAGIAKGQARSMARAANDRVEDTWLHEHD
ncbi:phage portal protein [Cryobacterium melibiosiphilum]|uniref:Phage portal protein n=1 Tax=Cryobacterium melibiosiphilum TaxID=995039 RepID=A0A3A5MJM2_9MICO|nr:phage portal protein [Cryobacterium melibiosiphilum]RJT88119.1 phage portal protein [Cryobacterium melibiosiphilum]